MTFIIIAAAAVLAGIVQGVTGFGTGLILMVVLPYFSPIPQSAGTSVAIAMALCVALSIRYRKELSIKKAVIPSFWYIVVNSVTIHYSTAIDPLIMKKALGVFLLILSIYYLFVKKSDRGGKLTLPVAFVCITVSAICDGLFGIGGPLMVLYYLKTTDSTREYLGTLQLFFVINGIYGSIFRFFKGVLGAENMIYIAAGWAGILIGTFIANKIVDKLNADILRKLVYILIGISGLINLL